MTVIPNYLKEHFKKEFEYQKQVRTILKQSIGINTPMTEENKDAVLKAREKAAKKTGYEPAKISVFGLGTQTNVEDIYGNPVYSPYEYPVYIFD